jgi:PAS domain S-box-containing protein
MQTLSDPSAEDTDVLAWESDLTIGGATVDVFAQSVLEDALRLRDIAMQAVVQGVTISDPTLSDNPIVYASPGFLQLAGYELDEVLGRNRRFLRGPDTDPTALAQISDAIRHGRPHTVELCNYRKDGTPFWNELSISPVIDADGRLTQIVEVQTDVTRRRQLDEQCRQSHELETIGQLSVGIAHDVNNMLTTILAHGDLLRQSHTFDQTEHESLTEISRAGERAALLTRQLLAFSLNQRYASGIVNINTIVRDMQEMLRGMIGKDVEISTTLQADLGHVMAAPGQLAQVLLDLALKACDAMPRCGKLVVESANVGLSPDNARSHAGIAPGDYVLLSVTSTVAEMARESITDDFGPHFVAKRPGIEAGLELSNVRGIVRRINGYIEFESDPGVAASFKVYIPRADIPAPRAGRPILPSEYPRGSERVLLVGDEIAERGLSRRVLEKCGYKMLEANDAESALTIARRCPEPIHLLVANIVMPDAGASALAGELVISRPTMRVLFVSGCVEDSNIRSGVIEDDANVIAKPFTSIALAQRVRDVLDGR